MPYNQNFITGKTVALPELQPSLQAVAFNGGIPVDHGRFSIAFHQLRGFAIYTAHNIDGATIIPEGEIARNNNFRLDPHVVRHLQVDNDRGYRNNPWDRGHLVRRRSLHWGDRDDAETADSESFFWTNIAPQHENLHDTAWGRIEDWMFEVTDDAKRQACVFTGPIFTPFDPEHINAPGEIPVLIPAGFWKIISLMHHDKLISASFLVWQRDYDREEPLGFDPILEQVRITTLEYLTGMSFASLRDADPLRFGVQFDDAPGRRTVRSLSARKRSTAITHPDDIFLPV